VAGAGDGGQAVVGAGRRGAGSPSAGTPAQRHPVRMLRLRVLVRVDLPVDVVVVLEQEERAGQAQSTECALGKRRCSRWGEHVFAIYGRDRTEAGRTPVRIA